MKVTWIGQAGLLFESAEGTTVIVDPYLSNSVEKAEPKNYRRKPIDESFLKLTPDFMVFTHNHLDHYDPETAPIYLASEKKMTVLSPSSVWSVARKNGGVHNYVEFNRGTVWTEKGLRFTAVKAAHSDACAIGVLIEEISCGRVFYVTGDTLYNNEIFADIPSGVYAIFLPINGVGNNMNATDASAFARRVGAKHDVPVHFGMFDEGDGSAFESINRIIPKLYEEIVFPD